MIKPTNIEHIRNELSKEGYALISDTYTNNKTKIEVLCSNNHKRFIRWNDWVTGYRCAKCARNVKYKIEEVQKIFADGDYTLLSTKYKNSHALLDVICSNGHIGKTTLSRFRSGHGCIVCAGLNRTDFNIVKTEIEREGYRVLSKIYNNNKSKIKVRCPNNHVYKTNWNKWQSGVRCRKCWIESITGENNPKWNNYKNKDKIYNSFEYQKWRRSVFYRDIHICQECGQIGGNLQAHHIFRKKDNPVVVFELWNGITLCEKCHESIRNKEFDYIERYLDKTLFEERWKYA